MTLKEEKKAKRQLREFIVLAVSLYAPPIGWTMTATKNYSLSYSLTY